MKELFEEVLYKHQPSPEGRYKFPICMGCSFSELDIYVPYPCSGVMVIAAIQDELR